METELKKPTVELSGVNGNAFMILSVVTQALLKAGYPQVKIDEYVNEAQSKDYDHLLAVTNKWVEVN